MKKPRMGRPPKPEGETLDSKVNFLCKAEERAAMEKAAETRKVKLSAWLRRVACRAAGMKVEG